MSSLEEKQSALPANMLRRISPTERVLWSGKPSQQFFIFRPMEWFLTPVSIGWGALTFLLAITILNAPPPTSAADLFIVGVDLLMAVAGVYVAAGRFFVDFFRRRHTWYAVTSKRIVIFRTFPTESTRSLEMDQLGGMRLEEGFGDRGTIRFPGGDETLFYLMGGSESWPWAAGIAPPSFERIHEARRVYDLIRGSEGKQNCPHHDAHQ